ncbi:hypothetical protein ACTI_52800 [Actinoplanes sp. OR16]|uniref:hypothetical protein n=1 Tax=Actinoplanes sp. OR16 TaxID=946334 RepID=UPI000F6D93A9|nr:hypothetical protein [Actinoplanes sp. OR16]BBH68595.1 hypothetical protein ACTI_52800 [Actinoplanes sp. OR16]
MRLIDDPAAARAALTSPDFVVPAPGEPGKPARTGIRWLRANVGRFTDGEAHERRRAAQVAVLTAIPLDALRSGGSAHPVETLARAMGVTEPVVDLVRDAAQAYQPGTGDEPRADAAVDELVAVFGGVFDEAAAARIGILVQACDATATLIDRARHRSIDAVLRDDPPVAATKRQALVTTSINGMLIEAGEVVRVRLAGDLAFGAGARRCPGRAHALALSEQSST